MALAPCPTCQRPVSTLAAACPHCCAPSPHARGLSLRAGRSWADVLQEAAAISRRYPLRTTLSALGTVWVLTILLGLLTNAEMLTQAVFQFPVVSLAILATMRTAVALTSTSRPVRDTLAPSAVIGGIVLVVWIRPALQNIVGDTVLVVAFWLLVIAAAIGGTVAFVRSQPFPADLVGEYRAAWYGRTMLWVGVLMAGVFAGALARKAAPAAFSVTYVNGQPVQVAPQKQDAFADPARWIGITAFLIAYCLINHGIKLLQWQAATRAIVESGHRETFAEFVKRNSQTRPPPS
jgi:hypothetical protein